ncbi:DUF4249 domain-containing protein [Algoriphagus aestuariicola]|uniref:DUF4249 domain-containing protein n=1 Tax=Algoriphagus aestuariicola TaxID=1852016 RepID=A0ABS3BVT6_9BACT|nr:DUF4249 domain-containing protein [Algoriphagus aestuariicola]MBN7802996.1 DUF4249 domain-containing protein [Algoriphagus aestuariicola]
MRKAIWSFLLLYATLQACRTPFDPEVSSEQTSFLVVEGYLDSDGKRSEIKMSRSAPLNVETPFVVESGASLTLTSASGESYGLQESEPGTYVFEADIPEGQTYTLEILLRSGERYQSDAMKPILTPDIIDAGYLQDEEGVEVFVTTQGDENADDFLWTYDETWIYRPRIRVPYIYDASIGDVRDRTEAEQIALCFKSEVSSDILLETSSRFEEQVVFRQTITEIPRGDERIMERYSILVSQKAIEEEAVKFWEILKKNTEDIGSIFSPLPSLIAGNIKSLDDGGIPVVGQVSMGVVRQKRLYINLVDVAPWNYLDPEFNDCIIEADSVLARFYDPIFVSGAVLPARPYIPPGGTVILGYFPTSRRCADCTLYASPITPDFWEDD